eukprot:scaffold66219_cov62-Phaeocystis_antarctica.AAC.1
MKVSRVQTVKIHLECMIYQHSTRQQTGRHGRHGELSSLHGPPARRAPGMRTRDLLRAVHDSSSQSHRAQLQRVSLRRDDAGGRARDLHRRAAAQEDAN